MDRNVIVFVVITYTFSIVLSIAMGVTGGSDSRLAGLGVAAMFFPAMAVLGVRLIFREKIPTMGWSRFPLKYLPFLLLMPVVMHAVMLPLTVAVEGRLPWQDWLTPQADGLYHTPASRGWGAVAIQGLVGRIAINAAVGLTVVSTLAFFEEVGWRTWLLPRLADRMGGRRAVVVTSLIWAFWHLPFAFSGIHHLEGVPAAWTAIIMAIGITGAGMIIGWLWLGTESIWIVSLTHGALNNWGQYAFKFMQTSVEHDASNALVLGAGNVALLALGSFLLSLPNGLSLVPSNTSNSKARDGTAIQPDAGADDSPRRG